MTNSPTIDSDTTIRVNVIRAFAAGLVWGGFFAVGLLALGVFSWFTEPGVADPLVLTAPAVGIGGLFMPLGCLIITVLMDLMLGPLYKIPVLGFLVGIFVPNMSLFTALVMIVGDPLVYILWRVHPPFVPITAYQFIMFCSYIRVEQASDGVELGKKPG